MRVIFIPDTPEFLVVLAALVLLVIGIALYQWLRPPAIKRLLPDGRYQQALAVYAANLGQPEPTPDERRQALAVAAEYLSREHGIAAEEAAANLRVLVAAYDRDQSYELRHEALAYEQAGAFQLALECFERAARLQEEHDPKDHQFLQRCVARVRGKVRPRREEDAE